MRSHVVLVLTASLAFAACDRRPPASPAADTATADDKVTVIAPGRDREPKGPDHVFRLREEIFGVVDPVDGKIVWIDAAGRSLGALALPAGFKVRAVDIQADSITLKGDTQDVDLPVRLDPARPLRLQARPPGSSATLVHRAGSTLTLSSPGLATITIPAASGGMVFTARYLGRDQAGRTYAYWEASSSGRAADAGAFAGRFSKEGRLEARLAIDLSDNTSVPALPVALTREGDLLAIVVGAGGVALQRLTFGDGRTEAQPAQSVGSLTSRVLDLGDTEALPPPLPPESMRETPPPYDPQAADAIIKTARSFLTATWTLRQENYEHAGIPNECRKEAQKYWLRPNRYSAAHVGKTMTSLPYKWGGFDSVEDFTRRISGARPALAGDVCTCREDPYGQCMVPEAAGVDCSGFVSRAWGLKSHVGTSSLPAVSVRLSGLEALQPGDALNRAGSHVRLFVRRDPGPQVIYRVWESAVSCGGVCENPYTATQLAAYVPIRLKRP